MPGVNPQNGQGFSIISIIFTTYSFEIILEFAGRFLFFDALPTPLRFTFFSGALIERRAQRRAAALSLGFVSAGKTY